MESVIRAAIEQVLQELGITEGTFSVEHPNDLTHGDYASNVALVVAPQAGKNPRALAEEIVAKLDGEIEYVESIEIAGPGFINFHLAREFFTHELARAAASGDAWGTNDRATGAQVIFEYTSPNLFKPLHVGNLVGNIIGESLTRLLEVSGATVHRVNYPSDIGLTVAKGVWGLQQTEGDPTDIDALGVAYRTGNEAYEGDGEAKTEIEAINRALYAGDNPELAKLREQGVATSKRHLDALCAKLGTVFDTEIPESAAGPKGKEIVAAHIADGVFTKSEGAIVYAGERDGLHTRVFLNSQGLPTYEAKDLGNFVMKQEQYPDWTQYVVVTGNEQREYFKVLYGAIRRIYPETAQKELVHVPTGFLTLTTGKMSSRKGNVLTGESLLAEMEAAAAERTTDAAVAEEVAVSALKYHILRNNIGSDIVFDKERALSFEGDSGPYLQYTNARINSVLEKATAAGIEPSTDVAPETPYALERLVYQFPEVVAAANTAREPHQMAVYLTELASAFNSFYAVEQIADTTDMYAAYKAAVAKVVGQTLQKGLWVLGIKAPERL